MLIGRRDLSEWEVAVAGSTPAAPIRATARKGSDTMTEHEYEVLSQIATFLEQQDKETREKLIIFCEGFVSATKLTEKGEKTA